MANRMRAGRRPARSKLEPLALSGAERTQLEKWTRRRGLVPALAMRARIVLGGRSGRSNRDVARRLGVTTHTVGKWRRRFLVRRLDGLLDRPRSGAPRSISDALVEAVLAKTLHEQPPDAARWSSRRLATALGISQRAVLRIWRAFDLQPQALPRRAANRRSRACAARVRARAPAVHGAGRTTNVSTSGPRTQ
jgi:transposase